MSLNTWDSGRARRPPKSRKREPRNSAMRPVPSGCVAFSIRTGYGARVTALRRAGNSLLRACILAAMDAARILVVDDARVVREMLAHDAIVVDPQYPRCVHRGEYTSAQQTV